MKKTIIVVLVFTFGLTMEAAVADFTFGTPTMFPYPVNSSIDIDTKPCISANSLELYFDSWREGSIIKSEDIWVANRTTKVKETKNV